MPRKPLAPKKRVFGTVARAHSVGVSESKGEALPAPSVGTSPVSRPARSGTSRVRAVLVGCDPGTTLGGSVERDLENVAQYLIRSCGARPADISVLANEGASLRSSSLTGVKVDKSKNWKQVVRAARSACAPNDTFVFMLSGHGMQTRDTSGDEKDGLDEYVQIEKGLVVKDDELRAELVDRSFSPVKLVLISDTCHSGTMFDLPFMLDADVVRPKLVGAELSSGAADRVCAVSVAACSDPQLAYCDVGAKVGYGGALTIQLIEKDALRHIIASADVWKLRSVAKHLARLGQTCTVCGTHGALFDHRKASDPSRWETRFR